MTTTAVPKTSRKGPITLTVVGAVLLIAAVVVAVMVARVFFSVVPTGVLSADGGPGEEAVGGTEVPGEVTVALEADSVYAVYLARPASAVEAELLDQVRVTAAGGADVTPVPGPDSNTTVNDVAASSILTFRTGAAGEYTVSAPPLTASSDAAWATVIVAPHHEIGGFVSSLLSSIAGVFIALGLGGAGIVLMLIGAVWWYTRSRTRKQVLAGTWVPRSAVAGYAPGAAPEQPHGAGYPTASGQSAGSAYPAPGQWHTYPGQYGAGPGEQPGPGQQPGAGHYWTGPAQEARPGQYQPGSPQAPYDPNRAPYDPQSPPYDPHRPPSDPQNPA
ncbi:MAG TPA: hypothetical protein VK086_09385 [Ruania sp.]|nr:hypothetical protein [Ruania sp.]